MKTESNWTRDGRIHGAKPADDDDDCIGGSRFWVYQLRENMDASVGRVRKLMDETND